MSAADGQPADSTQDRASFFDRMLPASAAGMIGAAAAMAVSLPLRSPDDLFANAASVAVVSVIGTTVLGLVWAYLNRLAPSRQVVAFAVFGIAAFAATVVAAVIAERTEDLSNVTSFTAPLAGCVLAIAALGAPITQRYIPTPWLRIIVPLLGIALIAAGVLLTVNEIGFNEPPSLALPPPP